MQYARCFISSLAVVVALGCGGDDGGDGGSAVDASPDEQRWELMLPDGTSITGTSAEQTDDRTIVLSASEPQGWSFTFVTEDPLAPGYFDSTNATGQVTATVENPSGDTCSVGPSSSGGEQAFLNYGGVFEDVPAGSGGVVATCFDSTDQENYNVAFGAP